MSPHWRFKKILLLVSLIFISCLLLVHALLDISSFIILSLHDMHFPRKLDFCYILGEFFFLLYLWSSTIRIYAKTLVAYKQSLSCQSVLYWDASLSEYCAHSMTDKEMRLDWSFSTGSSVMKWMASWFSVEHEKKKIFLRSAHIYVLV